MEIKNLRYFLAVAREENMSKAASRQDSLCIPFDSHLSAEN